VRNRAEGTGGFIEIHTSKEMGAKNMALVLIRTAEKIVEELKGYQLSIKSPPRALQIITGTIFQYKMESIKMLKDVISTSLDELMFHIRYVEMNSKK